MEAQERPGLVKYQQDEVCKKIHPKKFLQEYLQRGVRPEDNRKHFSYRAVSANVKVIKNSCGSSIIKIGNTTVVCGINSYVVKPSKMTQNKGLLDINCKMSDHCNVPLSHKNRVVQYKQLTSVLQKLFIGLKVIDLESLCISQGEWVWFLRAHIVCLDYDGAFWDSAVLALYLALATASLPEILYNDESKRFLVTESHHVPLKVGRLPLATTFGVFQNFVFADPTYEEEELATSYILVVGNDEEIKMIQKRGSSGINDEQLVDCIQVAKGRYKMMEEMVRSVRPVNEER